MTHIKRIRYASRNYIFQTTPEKDFGGESGEYIEAKHEGFSKHQNKAKKNDNKTKKR
jgi:hypothetical protein